MPMAATVLQRNTLIGLLVGLALAGGKLLAGLMGHSSALVADAVESMADTVGSLVVWQGFRVADRPADEAHPYGYGRAEALSGLSVGALLLIAAVIIAVRAVEDLLTPHDAPAAWTLAVLVGVIIVKELLFRLINAGATKHQSDAARADAWHHRADAITSLAAFIGVAIAVWGPGLTGIRNLILADEVAALVASGIIVFTGVGLMRPALRELLDGAEPLLAEEVRATAEKTEGVRVVEKVHTRKSGRGYLVDMHLHVDPMLSVREAHCLSGKVKAVVRGAHPSVRHVLIHIEPDDRVDGSRPAPPEG